jgi:dUTP pyrophosphatase
LATVSYSTIIGLSVAVKIPHGYMGLVFNRSSQGKIHVTIPHSVGVIDSDYRGNIKVLLQNNGEDPYFISRYTTRIAQLVVVPIALVEFESWDAIESWEDTARGQGGFGSTG